jgi:hypothetical protein
MARTGKELFQQELEGRLEAAELAFRTATEDIARCSVAVAIWEKTGYQGELLDAMQALRTAQIAREETAEQVGRLQHALEALKDLQLE